MRRKVEKTRIGRADDDFLGYSARHAVRRPGADLGRVTWGPIRSQGWSLSLAAALSVVQIVVELAMPWPLAIAVDGALSGDNAVPTWLGDGSPEQVLLLCGLATVLLTVVAGLLDMAGTRAGERAAERIGAQLRARILHRTLTLSLRWHDGRPSGELVSRLTTDVGRVLDAAIAMTATLVPDVLTLVGVLVLLLLLNVDLALVGLAVIPLLAVLTIYQRSRVRATQVAVRAESGRLVGTTSDLLRNVRAIQAFGRFDRAAEAFESRNRALLDAAINAVNTETRWTPLSDVVLALGAGLVLVFGGFQVLDGALTVGGLLIVLSYLRDLYSPVRSLTRLSTTLAKASASASRVADILDCREAVSDASDAVPLAEPIGIVELQLVHFSYQHHYQVLNNFCLTVRRGETVCLLGPSGSGKSTVLHLLLRLYDVDRGRILINGVDIRRYSQQSLRDEIAFVPQDPWLLDGTVAENIAFGSGDATRGQIVEAGRRALVGEFIDRLPLGYDSPIGENATRLSGGQRRRVAIARATVSNASLILLDEPTASLDADAAGKVIQAIRAATAQRTTLIVTHDPMLAGIADRVVFIEPSDAEPRPKEEPILTDITGGGEST